MARRGSSYKGIRHGAAKAGNVNVGAALAAQARLTGKDTQRKKLSNAEFRKLRMALADTDDRLWQLQRSEHEID